jgi:hypothetical protein
MEEHISKKFPNLDPNAAINLYIRDNVEMFNHNKRGNTRYPLEILTKFQDAGHFAAGEKVTKNTSDDEIGFTIGRANVSEYYQNHPTNFNLQGNASLVKEKWA